MGASIKKGVDDGFATNDSIPVSARMGIDILKPKDWPAFQRNCVVLFREELRDPNTKEYGRNGQKQNGIDILGYRNANPAHPVGIQCRRYVKSITREQIMKDCRAALALEFGLREVIFATTAPDDTKSDQAAKAVERALREEGLDVVVTIYGWGQLQTLISLHEPAFNAFVPNAIASTRAVAIEAADDQAVTALAARLADELIRRGSVTLTPPPASAPAGPDGIGDEDPALHAKIDVYRDLVRDGDPMKKIIFTALLAALSATTVNAAPRPAHQADTRVFTDADGFHAEETPGGYEPAGSPLSGPVTAETKVVFVPQALTPSEAYPAPASKTYPPCMGGRTDECRQPR